MLSFVLTLTISMAFAFADNSIDQDTDCNFTNHALNVYQHPNATFSQSIPALVSTDSTFMNSTTQNWQILESLGTVPDTENVVNPQAQELWRYLFLDTSSTINSSSGSSSLAGCSFTFAGLNASDLKDTMADGNCGNIFGSDCMNEFMQVAREQTAAIKRPVESSKSIDVCNTISQAVNNYIKNSSNACAAFKNLPTIGITHRELICPHEIKLFANSVRLTFEPTLAFDLSTPYTDSCTNSSTPLPLTLYEESAPFQPGNFSTYDQWASTPMSVLLALFSNDSAHGDFAQTYLTCSNGLAVKGDSHAWIYDKSAADRSEVASVKIALGFALVINALAFLVL